MRRSIFSENERRSRGRVWHGATWVPTDALCDESGFTTFGAAVAILLSCCLLFFGLWSARSISRAAGMQSVADACALAAENEVAEFDLSVRVADATLLTMSLTGLSLVGIGTVCCCVPGAQSIGVKVLDAGRAVIEKREDVARAQEVALNAAQKALPLVAQTQAQLVSAENSEAIGVSSVAYVELVPLDALDVSCGVASSALGAAEEALERSDEISEKSQEAEQAAKAADEALRQGWLADCGAYPSPCMRERAESLSDISSLENPMANSPNTWSYSMALKRARAYYRQRLNAEAPLDASAAEQMRSALRERFYEYASKSLDDAHAVENSDGTVDIDLPILPRNTDEMKSTSLYTDAVYPVSQGKLHGWSGCSAIETIEGQGSLSQLDAGQFSQCEVCGFDSASLGSVASASTSIENGFEYHYRKVAESARDYQESKNASAESASEVKAAVGDVFEALGEALSEAAGNRVEAYPPGRNGSLAVIVGDMEVEEGSSFFENPALGSHAAISAAVIVDDAEQSAISGLLSGLEGETPSAVFEAGSLACELWSALLGAYGKGVDGLRDAVAGAIDAIPLASASGLGEWAADKLLSLLEDAGLEPANMASPKAVTSNTSPVAAYGSGPVACAIRALKEE